uniref:glycosyltransferase family 2 protein n=1 Tax=Ningiella ruwaisensis TaxID=2364274 RepID=UPI001F4FF38C|nr:glycosyltransferase family 2 protein [Ningiella ruwaisensis]
MSFEINYSIVIPAKNEAENIRTLVDEIFLQFSESDDFEIVYVDDGSSDNTSEIIKQVSANYPGKIVLARHDICAGQSTAIYTGVCAAAGRLIITLDADGQNNPADIPKLLKRASTFSPVRDFCITGFRKHRKDTAYKRLQSKIANKVRAYLLKDDTPDTGCGLKVFPRHTFLKLPYFNHMHRYLPALIKRVGGCVEIVEVSHRERKRGESKYGMWERLFAGIIDLLGVMWLQRRSKSPSIAVYRAQVQHEE